MASQLLSAMKSTGLWVVSYFTNNPSNRKEAHSGSKVDVEAPASSSSSSTPSHPISSPSRQPNIQSESQTQTHLSNPIAKAFRELEMGKSFLTFILPTTTMILALHGKDSSPGVLHSMLCLLCASLVALLYGISLRDLFPGIANASEQLGIAWSRDPLPWFPSKNRETFEECDDGALTLRGGRRRRTHNSNSNSNSKIPKSPILHGRSKGRTKHQETSKPIKPRCRRHHFRLDSSPVMNLNTSDITGGLETSQQFRWWFGQMLSTCDQLQEKDDA
ncbi:hypothetical protein LOK49_Contig138G00013 [Camellia lanceoleosa]|nr:hypothetical protein LOK49_Contig138G00013 [Camellia lanceoleosa]